MLLKLIDAHLELLFDRVVLLLDEVKLGTRLIQLRKKVRVFSPLFAKIIRQDTILGLVFCYFLTQLCALKLFSFKACF